MRKIIKLKKRSKTEQIIDLQLKVSVLEVRIEKIEKFMGVAKSSVVDKNTKATLKKKWLNSYPDETKGKV